MLIIAYKYVTQRKYDIKTESKLTEIEINDVRYRSNFMTFFDRKWGFVDIVRAVIWQLGRALVTVAVVKSELVVVEELHFRLIVSLSTLLVSKLKYIQI